MCVTQHFRALVHGEKRKMPQASWGLAHFLWMLLFKSTPVIYFYRHTRKVEFKFRYLTPRLILFPLYLPSLSYKLLREREKCVLFILKCWPGKHRYPEEDFSGAFRFCRYWVILGGHPCTGGKCRRRKSHWFSPARINLLNIYEVLTRFLVQCWEFAHPLSTPL